MAGDGNAVAQSAFDAAKAQSQSEILREQAVRVFDAIATTEENVAETLNRVAEIRPHEADYLQALSETARRHAAQARQWARDYSRRVDRKEAD